ncbi:MAG TPA: diguanylate cyclase, partial [Halomonas sp.]|nr:diguanylate cyclase [Halomonas sp.]
MVRGIRRPYVSEPFVGRASGMPLVLISVPRIDEDGKFAGFIGGIVSLESSGLFNRLGTIRLGEEGYAAVATASGRILYHPDNDLVNADLRSDQLNPLLELALAGWKGEGVTELADGNVSLQAYAQVWPADWVIGLFLPADQAQLPLSGFIYKLLGIWFALALIMMPLLWWLLARILKPLDHL